MPKRNHKVYACIGKIVYIGFDTISGFMNPVK